MDADDFSFPDRLKLQSTFLQTNPEYGAVGGLVEYISHSFFTEGFNRYVNWSNSIITYEEFLLKQFIEMPIVNPSAMWRKDVAQEFGLYRDGDFPEDYEMWLRWLSNGVKIAKVPHEVLKWYDSDERLTRTSKIYSDQSFYKIKTKYLALWLEKNNPFHPVVGVWGASRTSRKRAILLEENNIEIEFFIDIRTGRKLKHEVILYTDIPTKDNVFILVYMKKDTAQKEISEFLQERGFLEGINYLMIS